MAAVAAAAAVERQFSRQLSVTSRQVTRIKVQNIENVAVDAVDAVVTAYFRRRI